MENEKTRPVLTGTLQIKTNDEASPFQTVAKVALWTQSNGSNAKAPKYKGTVKYGKFDNNGKFIEDEQTVYISVWEQ